MDLKKEVKTIIDKVENNEINSDVLERFNKILWSEMKSNKKLFDEVSQDVIEWFKVLIFLLRLYENNNFEISGDEWKKKGIDFPKLKKIVDEMDNKNLFHIKIWSIGGNCHIEVIDKSDFLDFLNNRIHKYLNIISKKKIEIVTDRKKISIEILSRKITFYVVNEIKEYEYKYPYVLLKKEKWDDFDYKTLYLIEYFPSKNTRIQLGSVKILDVRRKSTNLPKEFKRLDKNFLSLGQSINYYEMLIEIGKKHYQNILFSLRDIVYDRQIDALPKNIEGVNKSLTRSSEAERAFDLGKTYFYEDLNKTEEFSFKFLTHLDNAEKSHEISFNFEKDPNLPFRIMVLIGENATGKTQYLARLALALSGEETNIGNFVPKRPKYSKVIAISYSPFDDFERPKEKSKTSYVYCGLRNKNNDLDIKKIQNNFINSYNTIEQKNRIGNWKRVLEKLIQSNQFKELEDNLSKKELQFSINSNLGLSTGQIAILSIFTDVIANIEPESLILFEEPETYLHPNAIGELMSTLFLLLKLFNSYAIITTHSPQILQEIPSKFVRVLERIDNNPFVRKIGFESFGENIDNITKEIFGMDSVNINFRKNMKKMIQNLSYEQIEELFENNLSLNAKMNLKAIQKEKQS